MLEHLKDVKSVCFVFIKEKNKSFLEIVHTEFFWYAENEEIQTKEELITYALVIGHNHKFGIDTDGIVFNMPFIYIPVVEEK